VSLEIERAGAVAAALQVALRRAERARSVRPAADSQARHGGATAHAGHDAPVVLAVPRRTLRELAPGSPIPVVQRRPTCRVRLKALLAVPGATDAERLAQAYLGSLDRRSPLLVPSSWFAARVPEVNALLRAAGPCRCEGLACAHAPGAGAMLVSHELALDWLERHVPMALLVLDAERLPSAERGRASVRLDRARLDRLAAQRPVEEPFAGQLLRGARALDDALGIVAQAGGTTLDLRARVWGPWLELRDVLTGLRKDTSAWLSLRGPDAPEAAPFARLASDLARLAEPPPPGFVTRVYAGARPVLVLEPHHPEAALVARLPRATVLVTGTRGGLAWARRPVRRVGPLSHPTVELEPCAAGVNAVAMHAGRLALRLAGPVNLVAEGALEPFAEAVRAAFPELAVRTVPGAPAPRGACVTLVPWPGPTPPDALATLLGPVRDVRRAVLSCGDREVTVLTPVERRAEFEAALDDLLDDGGGPRLADVSGGDIALR
jgi:hypothetical protein